MSKPPHEFRGTTTLIKGMKWFQGVDRRINDARKGARSYKSNVFDAHQNDLRKQTLMVEMCKAPTKGLGFFKYYTKQSKVRPVVQARLDKLRRYIYRSWRIGSKAVFDDVR